MYTILSCASGEATSFNTRHEGRTPPQCITQHPQLCLEILDTGLTLESKTHNDGGALSAYLSGEERHSLIQLKQDPTAVL